VLDSLLEGNTAPHGGGGAIQAGAGTLTVGACTFRGNSAGGGGALDIWAPATISDTTLTQNVATGGPSLSGGGGAIGDIGPVALSNCTLSDNSAAGDGGGIAGAGWKVLTNVTVSGNTAAGRGGGIAAPGGAGLTNVTVTANRAGSGGGLSGNATPHNTLIAGNFGSGSYTGRDDVAGNLASSGDYNLIGDGSGMAGLSDGVNGNQVGSAASPIDPRLGPLADNGGPTLTHALLAGSPALRAGSVAYATATDQRGLPRVVDGSIDIGAYQTQDYSL
jgi:predicted outer membrane repeat protein